MNNIEQMQLEIQENFAHLVRVLQVGVFVTLTEEDQLANIDEARKILDTTLLSNTSKRQLLCLLEVLPMCQNVEVETARRIKIILDEFNYGNGQSQNTQTLDSVRKASDALGSLLERLDNFRARFGKTAS